MTLFSRHPLVPFFSILLALSLAGCPAAKLYKEGKDLHESGSEYAAAEKYLDALETNGKHKKARESLEAIREDAYKERLGVASDNERGKNFPGALSAYQDLDRYLVRLDNFDLDGFATVNVKGKIEEMRNSAAEERYQAGEGKLGLRAWADAIAEYRAAQGFKARYKDTAEKVGTAYYSWGDDDLGRGGPARLMLWQAPGVMFSLAAGIGLIDGLLRSYREYGFRPAWMMFASAPLSVWIFVQPLYMVDTAYPPFVIYRALFSATGVATLAISLIVLCVSWLHNMVATLSLNSLWAAPEGAPHDIRQLTDLPEQADRESEPSAPITTAVKMGLRDKFGTMGFALLHVNSGRSIFAPTAIGLAGKLAELPNDGSERVIINLSSR